MRNDEWAVSDVLGNVLLIGITVTSFAALTFLVGNIPAPPDSIHAELSVQVTAGPDQSWSTGDEQVTIRHLYGESLPTEGTYVLLAINNATQRFEGDDLAFSGGLFDIGETWSKTTLIGFNDVIGVDVGVARGSGTSIMTSTQIITGESNCASDNDPPHAIISQEPTNIEALTGSSDAVINALLVDICSNVDALNDPVLEYWFDTGPHTSIVMDPQGGDTWRTTVPAPNGNWLTKAGSSLSYSITAMADSLGNAGNSPVVTDFVDPLPPDYYYVTNRTAILGGITDFHNMQNGTDVGAAATLSEGLGSGGSTVLSLYGGALSPVLPDTNSVWDKPADILGSDTSDARYKADPDPSINPIRVTISPPPPSTDQITNLKVVLRGQTSPDNVLANNDDGWRLQVCWRNAAITGGTCSQKSGVLGPAFPLTPDMEADIAYDITNKRPGGGQWTWDDLSEIDVLVAGQIVGGIRDGDWRAQNVRIEVTHGPGYNMDHVFWWESPTLLTQGDLQLQYYTNGGEFRASVWDWTLSQWNPRTTPLNAIASTAWSTDLTAAEWNGGDPKVRLESMGTNPASQAALYVDYMRLAV